MDNINFKNKYIKYKNKYLDMKYTIYGGSDFITQSKLDKYIFFDIDCVLFPKRISSLYELISMLRGQNSVTEYLQAMEKNLWSINICTSNHTIQANIDDIKKEAAKNGITINHIIVSPSDKGTDILKVFGDVNSIGSKLNKVLLFDDSHKNIFSGNIKGILSIHVARNFFAMNTITVPTDIASGYDVSCKGLFEGRKIFKLANDIYNFCNKTDKSSAISNRPIICKLYADLPINIKYIYLTKTNNTTLNDKYTNKWCGHIILYKKNTKKIDYYHFSNRLIGTSVLEKSKFELYSHSEDGLGRNPRYNLFGPIDISVDSNTAIFYENEKLGTIDKQRDTNKYDLIWYDKFINYGSPEYTSPSSVWVNTVSLKDSEKLRIAGIRNHNEYCTKYTAIIGMVSEKYNTSLNELFIKVIDSLYHTMDYFLISGKDTNIFNDYYFISIDGITLLPSTVLVQKNIDELQTIFNELHHVDGISNFYRNNPTEIIPIPSPIDSFTVLNEFLNDINK